MNIAMQDVKSSNVKAIGYDSQTQTLRVQFLNGGIYDYAEVPPDVHAEMMRSKSVGSFLATNVKGKFKSTKL